MKMFRINATIVATLAVVAGGSAHAQTAAPADTGSTVRLDTVQKLWVLGDELGPKTNGVARIGKNTGAGVMDTNFIFDETTTAKAKYDTEVLVGTTYTRSSLTPNGNNSYMQGGFATGKITAQGVTLGAPVDLPQLNGERAFMRPLIAFTPTHTVLIAASEDNESNNGNPKPVLYIADKTTNALATIPNNPRKNQARPGGFAPLDLMRLAVRSGVTVQNENNQRGPHMIVPVGDNKFVVGMQYNNQAQEAFGLEVAADGTAKVTWVERYTNNAVHNRPQIAYTPGAATAFLTAGECNAQPINIGLRVTEFNVATGKPLQSKIVVRAQPNQNKYLAEPHISDMGDKVAILWGATAKARANNNNGNGHAANGSNVSMLQLFSKATLAPVGDVMIAPATYQRHPGMFTAPFGPNGEPAIAVISGSSTATSRATMQIVPLKADGTLGLKDPMKLYTVSTYSDVANLPVRGKRNPNNQAKGFINGLGAVPNPGYGKAGGFYSEVKFFSMSAVPGYSSDAAKTIGKRESLYLSLVPSVWKPGIQTTPGTPTDNAGSAPAPIVNAPPTLPAGEVTSTPGGSVATGGTETTPGNAAGDDRGEGSSTRGSSDTAGGCSVSKGETSNNGVALFGLALAGAFMAVRRRKNGEK